MAFYRFTAEDASGRRIDDRIEASNVEESRRLLEQRGLRVLEIAAAEEPVPESRPLTPGPSPETGEGSREPAALSNEEAQQLAGRLADLSLARLPLAPGLRAAADESDSPRQAAALRWLAGQIEQGRSLDEALASPQGLVPRSVGRLIAAAARTGQLGATLSELAAHQQAMSALRQGVLRSLAYPLVVGCLATAIFVCLLLVVGGMFEKIYLEFGVSLPMITKVFFWWRHAGIWVAGGGLALAVIAALIVRSALGPARWSRFLATLPVAGPLWHWSGLAEWSGLMVLLVRHQVPLPEALRLAADGVANAHVAQLSLSLAEGVARGRALSQMITLVRQMPASLGPLVRWGEKEGNLADSLAAGREMLEERVRMRSFWLQTILPPILFIAIGCGVMLFIGALFIPMIGLLSALTGP